MSEFLSPLNGLLSQSLETLGSFHAGQCDHRQMLEWKCLQQLLFAHALHKTIYIDREMDLDSRNIRQRLRAFLTLSY